MEAFTEPDISAYPNEGDVSSGVYALQRYASPTEFGLLGNWSISRVVQAQVPIWDAQNTKIKAFKSALEGRTLEDTWITHRPCITPASYAAELATSSWSLTTYPFGVDDSFLTYAEHKETLDNRPAPEITTTPCETTLVWPGKRGTYKTLKTDENVLAYYDPTAPELLPVTHEFIPGGKYSIVQNALSAERIPLEARAYIEGNYYWEIQPARFNDTIEVLLPWQVRTDGLPTDWVYPRTVSTEAELGVLVTAIFRGQVDPTRDPDVIKVVATLGGSAYNDTPPLYLATADWATVGNTGGSVIDATDISVAGTPLADTVKMLQFWHSANPPEFGFVDPIFRARPKVWDHTDPEFVGYVPYQRHMWVNKMSYILAYAKEPDGRFDGFYFAYKVSISVATRAWNSFVRNVLTDTDPSFFPFNAATLELVGVYDTITGETLSGGTAWCPAMTPIDIGAISSDVVGSPEIDPGYWADYPWPSLTIELPAGTFFLEDGSAAPIYPTFYGAYVYDLHLKKWGKMDGEYKRLMDYMAINTYMPNQQSFDRFGLFGGILDAAGKVHIFDDKPSDSWIKYGKIGYYRQGMTSMEEVRVHHKDGATGKIEIESSVEGKLLTPGYEVSSSFTASSMWQHNGSYAAKWHNIVISGRFDLTYLEFRGIPTGRR